MAYFAELDKNNVVIRVIAISNENAPDPYPESESLGQQFIAGLGLGGRWMQTSYKSTFRKNFCGAGHTYDPVRDAFIPPKPDDRNWILNEESCQWELADD